MKSNMGLNCLLVLATVFGSTLAVQNASSHVAQGDSLSSLGDITTKLVSTLVDAEGEQVDIYGMANLVTALSKGATIVDHPDLYKALENSGAEEELIKLSSTVKVLAQQQRILQEKVEVQREQLEVMDDIASQLNQSKQLITRLEEQLDEPAQDSGSSFVGFTAWADVSDYYNSGATIKFPRVLFSYGSGYDSYGGTFECPFSGIYSVNVHLEERNSGGLLVKLMLDSEYFNKLHVHDDSVDHDTSSISAMVGCRRGQKIYVQTEDSGSDAEVQSIERRSIFSVYLVQRMSDEDIRTGNFMESG